MTQPHFPPGSQVPQAAPGLLPAPGPVPGTPAALPTPLPTGPATPAPRRRISGIDVARAVAILGMLAAHLGTGHASGGGGWGEQWMWIFDGRSSALFATLAGVSIALMTRSTAPSDRLGWRRSRVKIAIRAAILLPLGIALQMLGTPVVVILPAYAVMFLMTLPVLRLPTRWVLGLAGAVVAVGPVLVLGLRHVTTGTVGPTTVNFGFGWGELVTGYYPGAVWIAYLLVGMAIGRGALASRRYAAILLGVGVAVAVAGYGLGTVLGRAVSSSLYPTDFLYWPDVLLSVEPHSTSSFEVLGNLGVSAAVIGVCLLATSGRVGELLLTPLAAAGSMSLTIYSAQLVVISILGADAVYYPESNVPLLVLAAGSIAFAWAWRAVLGQGPLERLLKVASDGAARGVRA